MLVADAPSRLGVNGPILEITDAEMAVASIPSLIAWWRADRGMIDPPPNAEGTNLGEYTAWLDCWNLIKMVPKNAPFPPIYQPAGLAGKPAVRFGAAPSNQSGQSAAEAGFETWPVGKDYTIVVIFSTTTTSASNYLVASGDPTDINTARININGGTGAMQLVHRGSPGQFLSIAGPFNNGAPHQAVFCYDFEDDLAVSFADGVLRGSAAVTTELYDSADNRRLCIGGGGASGFVGGLINGSIAEVLSFGAPLHRPEHAASLAAVHALRTPYGIA